MLRRNFLRNAAVGLSLLFGGNSLLGAKPAPAALPPSDPAGATAAASVDTAPDAVFEKQAPITTAEWARRQVKGVAAVEVNGCAGWIQRVALCNQFFEGNNGWAELFDNNGRRERNSFVDVVQA